MSGSVGQCEELIHVNTGEHTVETGECEQLTNKGFEAADGLCFISGVVLKREIE